MSPLLPLCFALVFGFLSYYHTPAYYILPGVQGVGQRASTPEELEAMSRANKLEVVYWGFWIATVMAYASEWLT